jgi:hypothetical protein
MRLAKESANSAKTRKENEVYNELIDRTARLIYRNQRRYDAVPGSPTECVSEETSGRV